MKTHSDVEFFTESYGIPEFLQHEVGERLLERLELMRLQPERVLDLGCGNGMISEALLSKYRKARVIGLDVILDRVQKTCQRGGWLRKPLGVCADIARLPLKPDCIDMAISNLMLQCCNDLPLVFSELVKAIRPEGLLLFSTLGPDTLQELRASWGAVDDHAHGSRFVDMHDVGDALLQAGFRDPVMDMEVITLTYREVDGLLKDLQESGAANATSDRNRDLTGIGGLQALKQRYEQFRLGDGKYPATYEVIYGHAWAPEIGPSAKPERYIPIQSA